MYMQLTAMGGGLYRYPPGVCVAQHVSQVAAGRYIIQMVLYACCAVLYGLPCSYKLQCCSVRLYKACTNIRHNYMIQNIRQYRALQRLCCYAAFASLLIILYQCIIQNIYFVALVTSKQMAYLCPLYSYNRLICFCKLYNWKL